MRVAMLCFWWTGGKDNKIWETLCSAIKAVSQQLAESVVQMDPVLEAQWVDRLKRVEPDFCL